MSCGVRGVFARRDGRWVLENESELSVLVGLGANREGVNRLRAMEAALNAGTAGPGDLARLSRCLQALADSLAEDEEVCWALVPEDLMGAVTVACAHWDHEKGAEWLCWVLAGRLDSNLTDAWHVKAGWMCWEALLEDRPPRAWWPATGWLERLDSGFWDRIASHPDPEVRATNEASNPSTTPSRLRSLGASRQEEILDLVASHPRACAKQLLEIAGTTRGMHAELLWRTAQNKSAPRLVLDRIASDSFYRKDGSFDHYIAKEAITRAKWLVAQNPNTSPNTLTRLSRSEDTAVRSWVATHPSTPEPALERLAADQQWQVRMPVAWNPSTPNSLLVRLASDRRCEVRAAAASNPKLPEKLLELLARDRTITVRAAAASNPKLPEKLLELLARDRHMRVRRSVLWRGGLSPEMLAGFAADPDPWIRRCAAGNRFTPADALALIADEADEDVFETLAANPNTPPATLLRLARSENAQTRLDVAGNPSAPPEALELLANDRYWLTREHTAANPVTPSAVLERLSASPSRFVRAAVAANPATPARLVEQLALDGCYCVFTAAAGGLAEHRDSAAAGGAQPPQGRIYRASSAPAHTEAAEAAAHLG